MQEEIQVQRVVCAQEYTLFLQPHQMVVLKQRRLTLLVQVLYLLQQLLQVLRATGWLTEVQQLHLQAVQDHILLLGVHQEEIQV